MRFVLLIWIAKNYHVRRFLLWNMVCRSNWLRDLFIYIFMLLDSWFMYTIYKRIYKPIQKCSKRSSKWNTIKCVKCLFVFLNAFGAFAGIVCIVYYAYRWIQNASEIRSLWSNVRPKEHICNVKCVGIPSAIWYLAIGL